MHLSNNIETFLIGLLNDEDGQIEIKRNELADRLGCVPSQINYVIQTRFTKERGYIVESRRGGGGFIRIRRISVSPGETRMHILNSIGDKLDYETLRALLGNLVEYEQITQREARLILAALNDNTLARVREGKNVLRADIFKNILINLL